MKYLIAFSIFLATIVSHAATEPIAFKIRNYETQKLKNGMTVLWIPDPSLPYISLSMLLKSGSSADPQGKEGLAGFTASMLEKGSTKRSATKIAEDLEQLGIGFSAGVDNDYTMITASALSFYKDEVLKQFAELVFTPSFTLAEIERHRKNLLGGIQKLADSPQSFTDYLLPHFLYGSHPYGHSSTGTTTSVKAIKRVDLQRFYNDNYSADRAIVAIVGQFDDDWKKQVVKTFEGWKAKGGVHKELPEFPDWKGKQILLVDRGDLNQAQIQIGFKGVPRKFPEYLELRAALKILGESFGSRLFEEIRVKRGLTYHIRAWFDPRMKPGPMGIYTFTRVDKVAETIQETLNTYKKFVDEGVTDAEVGIVKALMRGQFPRTFETPEALGRQLLLLDLYEISPDYLIKYLADVDAMTEQSINATIKKYFDVENLKILVYAPKKQAEALLKPLGKVEVKSYKDFLQ